MVTGRKAGKKRRKPTESDDDEPAMGSKRGKQGATGDDSGDGMTETDREKLGAMNELEREMYLYEREEQLQKARLGKAVLEQTRNRDEQVRSRLMHGLEFQHGGCFGQYGACPAPGSYSSSLPASDCQRHDWHH